MEDVEVIPESLMVSEDADIQIEESETKDDSITITEEIYTRSDISALVGVLKGIVESFEILTGEDVTEVRDANMFRNIVTGAFQDEVDKASELIKKYK